MPLLPAGGGASSTQDRRDRRRGEGLASPPMRSRPPTEILAGIHSHLHMQLATAIIDERLRDAEERQRIGQARQPGGRHPRHGGRRAAGRFVAHTPSERRPDAVDAARRPADHPAIRR